MKQTQAVYLTFAQGQSTTTATIRVPFLVRKIHIKNASLTSVNQAVTGVYITVESDLIQTKAPVCTVYSNSSYSAGTVQDIEHQLWNPQPIQGVYNFTMYDAGGYLYESELDPMYIALIIEFNDASEP
jgi:hypothetical protein